MKATHQIVGVSKEDAYYEERKMLKGKRGFFTEDNDWGNGYRAGLFQFLKPVFENNRDLAIFYEVKLKEL